MKLVSQKMTSGLVTALPNNSTATDHSSSSSSMEKSTRPQSLDSSSSEMSSSSSPVSALSSAITFERSASARTAMACRSFSTASKRDSRSSYSRRTDAIAESISAESRAAKYFRHRARSGSTTRIPAATGSVSVAGRNTTLRARVSVPMSHPTTYSPPQASPSISRRGVGDHAFALPTSKCGGASVAGKHDSRSGAVWCPAPRFGRPNISRNRDIDATRWCRKVRRTSGSPSRLNAGSLSRTDRHLLGYTETLLPHRTCHRLRRRP